MKNKAFDEYIETVNDCIDQGRDAERQSVVILKDMLNNFVNWEPNYDKLDPR